MPTEPMSLTRRSLLHASAVAAGAVVLAACSGEPTKPAKSGEEGTGPAAGKGSATTPLKAPAKFGESPALAAKAKAGELPAVADRLPENPYVVPHKWLQPGKYGGTLNLTQTANDPQYALNQNMYGHSILRWEVVGHNQSTRHGSNLSIAISGPAGRPGNPPKSSDPDGARTESGARKLTTALVGLPTESVGGHVRSGA